MSATEQPDTPIQPETIDYEGKPPKTRFSDSQSLWSVYQSARQEASRNDARFSAIRGIYDGFPPMDPVEQEKQGLADMPNVNLKQFQAKIDTYVSTWVDHNCGGEKLFEIRLKAKYFKNPQEREEASCYVTDAFNEAIMMWESEDSRSMLPYLLESCVRDTQMGLFGIGICYFRDPIDWRWIAVPTRSVYVPCGTKITLRNGQAVFIETEWTATELWDLVKEENADSDWNRENVLELLYNRTGERVNGQLETYASWENRIRNNQSDLQQYFRPIVLIDCYWQEFNTTRDKDGITHARISSYGANTDEKGGFLYKCDREFKTWANVLIPFSDSAGPEGDWHGVKGFGDLNYDGCHFNNLFFNQVATATVIGMFPMFQAQGEADRQKLSQMVFSRMGVLCPDLQLQPLKIPVDVSGGLEVLGLSNQTINQNARVFPQNNVDQQREAQTATQVTLDRQDQAKFTSLQIKFYRTIMDKMAWEMYRRISRPGSEYPSSLPGGAQAKIFRDKLKEYGIPEKAYRDPESVMCSRTGGTGNRAMDFATYQQVMNVATPGVGQQNAKKHLVAAIAPGGWEQVGEFVQDAPVITEDNVTVGLENALLNTGKQMPAFPAQDHLLHLGDPTAQGQGHLGVLIVAHSAAMQLELAGLESSVQDAQKISDVMSACVGHCKMHLEFLSQMPTMQSVTKELANVLNKEEHFLDNFNRALQAALQKQQQSSGLDAASQAKLIQAQVAAQATQAKAQQDMQIKEQKHLQEMGQMAEKHQAEIAFEERRTNQQLALDAEQTLIEQEQQKAKTRAEANAKQVPQ